MPAYKSKSLDNLEKKMQEADGDSLRHHILESAKNFKVSWIELGRALYSVHKDKLYKGWGYLTFDAYTAKEVGIRKQTAIKLLRSYFFLEKEEPGYLRRDYVDSTETSALPSYESVDVLRRLKDKKLVGEDDYASFKKQVFEKGKDAGELKKDLTALIRQREEFEPEEARERKKVATVRRFLGVLKSLRQEIEDGKLLPAGLIKETESLIRKLETEIS